MASLQESVDVEKLIADENFPHNIKESLASWRADPAHKMVNVLLTGKFATGKSALVNGLVGKEVAKESEGLDQETATIVPYVATIDGVSFKIWDTPGLQADPEEREVEIRKLDGIATDIGEVDLVLYCTRMDDSRIRKEDKDTISYFTKAFGEDIWSHAVFALTFANKVTPPIATDNKREYFEQKLETWKRDLRKALADSGVTFSVIESIPVVPAGYSEPSLPDGRENWLSAFWFVCLETMKEKARPALLHVNADRLKLPDQVSADDLKTETHRQPLIFGRIPTKVVFPAGLGAVGAVAGFFAGGILGSAVGASIGALSGLAGLFAHDKYTKKVTK